jgi:hypothetical protein
MQNFFLAISNGGLFRHKMGHKMTILYSKGGKTLSVFYIPDQAGLW